MNRAIAFALTIAMLVVSAAVTRATAQQSSSSNHTAASSSVPAAGDLAVGTTICVTLAKTIDAKSAKPGDAIVAHVTLPVLARGKVILPNDAKVTGHVVAAKAHTRGGPQSSLAIVFDRGVLKDGSEVPLALTVQAIGSSGLKGQEMAQEGVYDPPRATIATMPSSPTTRKGSGSSTAPPQPSDTPRPPEHPAAMQTLDQRPTLDSGSHGTVRLPNLTLTEATDATSGSVVTAKKKNVKLESGMEMILRVIEEPGDAKQKAKS